MDKTLLMIFISILYFLMVRLAYNQSGGSIKDGLDAISLTEHLEYQPYAKDIPNPDRNRAYNIAKVLQKIKISH